MTVAIVLAIYGRPRTTLATLRRYQRQTVPMEIVAVGTTDEDKGTAERAGVHFVQHANLPLSDKYQAGINYVRDHLDVEAIMTGGSDSWVSDDWCATGLQYMQKNGWDSVGKSVFYVMSLDTHEILYRGYLPQRAAEPDGNGRMVTRDALDTKLGWHLYPTRRGVKGIDNLSYRRCLEAGCTVGIMNDAPVHILELKADRHQSVNQFHQFRDAPSLLNLGDIKHPRAFIDRYFPASWGTLEALQCT